MASLHADMIQRRSRVVAEGFVKVPERVQQREARGRDLRDFTVTFCATFVAVLSYIA